MVSQKLDPILTEANSKQLDILLDTRPTNLFLHLTRTSYYHRDNLRCDKTTLYWLPEQGDSSIHTFLFHSTETCMFSKIWFYKKNYITLYAWQTSLEGFLILKHAIISKSKACPIFFYLLLLYFLSLPTIQRVPVVTIFNRSTQPKSRAQDKSAQDEIILITTIVTRSYCWIEWDLH